jgi:superfamily II DNA or RNA helicase
MRAAATELTLRDYQTETVDAVWNAWNTGMQRPAVVLPTGAGKTVIFAAMARQFHDVHGYTGQPRRVVVLVHRDELADQAIAKLRATAPDLDIGKVKAADDQVYADVMVCSVQTLARANRTQRLLDAQEVAGPVGLVIVDECHHAAAVSYRNVMAALGCYSGLVNKEDVWTGTKAVGFTATLARGDGVGLGGVWDDMVYNRSVLWMISRGYLVDPKGQEVKLDGLDLGGVKRTAGDYQAGALGEALLQAGGPAQIAEVVHRYAPGRRTIVFTPTVAVAEETVKELEQRGYTAAAVSAGVKREDTTDSLGRTIPGRLSVYDDFRTGRISVLVNCMVLTEGADFPMADCAVIARPTQSAPLFIQMVGRVLRPWSGKTDALVLDIAGTGGKISTLVDLDDSVTTAVRDGESLAEAYIRQEETANRVESHSGNTAFLLKHKELDLFTASSHVWLRTPGGVQFLSVSGGFVFLWPRADGLWNVGGAPERSHGTARWVVLHEGLTLGLAQAWAETEADNYSSFGIERQASWRRKRAEPRMISRAKSMGVPTDIHDLRQGDLSDAMAVKAATRVFDHVVKERKR